MTTKATARNHKANHKAKANGKAHAKPAPKPVQTTAILGVANTDIQTMSRKVLNSLCVKHMGAEPNPMIGDAPLRVFLTNLNNGMPRQEATAGLKKMVDASKVASKPNANPAPAPPPKAPVSVKPTPMPTPPPAREIIPQVAGTAVWITAATVGECPVDFFIEAILTDMLKPFGYFYASLKENAKAKKSDAVLQKEWDRHFPGWKVAEVRREFNTRLTTVKGPSAIAKQVPEQFKTH